MIEKDLSEEGGISKRREDAGVLTMSKGIDKVAFKCSGQVTTRVGQHKGELGK
jgi:hypothetical protein